MPSFQKRTKRKRGVILSSGGWQRLQAAQAQSEIRVNGGNPYTLESLQELTGLSPHTLTKVRRRKTPVDRQTLEEYFKAFNLILTPRDYTRPVQDIEIPQEQIIPGEQNWEHSTPASEIKPAAYNQEPLLPEGQVPLDSLFYVDRPPVETNCYKAILQSGALIRIQAPRRTGKTSLMARILNHATQQGCQSVFLSLQLADRAIFQDLDKFLQWFGASVGLGMQLPNRLADYWDELFGSKVSCKIYFEQYLLANTPQPLVLALDDVDRLFDYPDLADEFFGLLRTWHEEAKNRNVWKQLRLVVGHSTEVYIPLNVNKSPFNVGLPIALKPFTAEQVEDLAERYGLAWSQTHTKQLMEIAAGQPYLVQLALYSLWHQNLALEKLLQTASADAGIYSDHLQRQWWTLEQDPELAAAFLQVVQASTPVELELLPAFKLESMGLVRLQGNMAMPSCALYVQYFRDRLSNP